MMSDHAPGPLENCKYITYAKEGIRDWLVIWVLAKNSPTPQKVEAPSHPPFKSM